MPRRAPRRANNRDVGTEILAFRPDTHGCEKAATLAFAMSDSHVDIDRIRHVARLSALNLSADETKAFAGDLQRIVAYVNELASIDTTHVPATIGFETSTTESPADLWRNDRTELGLSHDEALAGAPQTENEGFAVPAFVE